MVIDRYRRAYARHRTDMARILQLAAMGMVILTMVIAFSFVGETQKETGAIQKETGRILAQVPPILTQVERIMVTIDAPGAENLTGNQDIPLDAAFKGDLK